MTPNARHGTRLGYRDDRCRCEACKKAIALEHNVYKLRRGANGGNPLTVDKLGSVRRLQALMVIGWPRRELARQAGYKGDAFALVLNGKRTRLTLASRDRIADLYDRLSMTPGPSSAGRIRCAKNGWPPPLAWLDIDDPDEIPDPGYRAPNKFDTDRTIDSTVIDRVLHYGDWSIRANVAERMEIIRRWVDSDRSLNRLDELTGWNVHRDLRTHGAEFPETVAAVERAESERAA